MKARFDPSGPLAGRLRPPADKSISHRAALFAAMSTGETRITNYLDAADTNSTLAACRALGADVRQSGSGEVWVRGVGAAGASPPGAPIDVGNAGTLMRLLPGWLATQAGRSYTLDGDASIRRRPVDRIATPLRAMGAVIEACEGRFAPFTVHGGELTGITYELPVASAQVKSCVLLAGLATDGTRVIERVPARDHTERMLMRAGAEMDRFWLPESGQSATAVRRGAELELGDLAVPADLSSAAFLIAAALLVPGSAVVLEGVGVNWTRTGFLRIAGRMGAALGGRLEEPAVFNPTEPVSHLEVAAGALAGTAVEAREVPLAIDELPLVALLGCFAEGQTVVRGAEELRVKESDRIATVVEGLRGLGGTIEATADGFVVTGTGGLPGGTIDAHGDHRLAMLGAVAGLASRNGVEVVGFEAAGVSYPGFAEDLATLGAPAPS